MPGVELVNIGYENSFARGATLRVQVRLPAASVEQIADVATTIDKIVGDDFENYDQWTDFAVAADRRVMIKRAAHLDPAEIAHDARIARDIAAALDGSSVEWFRNDRASTNRLEVKAPNSTATAGFAALRTVLADDAVDVSLAAAAIGWVVMFPFSREDEARVAQQIARMPIDVYAVSVGGHGAIARLQVALRDRVHEYEDLSTVIGLVGGGPTHPLYVYWTVKEKPSDPALRFQGSVTVGYCDYPNTLGEADPERYYTADAIALQERVRERFDVCPR